MRLTVIVKVQKDKFVKYNVTNLKTFESFLDRNFPNWCYYNTFDKETRLQLKSYTKNNRFSG